MKTVKIIKLPKIDAEIHIKEDDSFVIGSFVCKYTHTPCSYWVNIMPEDEPEDFECILPDNTDVGEQPNCPAKPKDVM